MSRITNSSSKTREGEACIVLGENAAKLFPFDLDALRPFADKANIIPGLAATGHDEISADSQCLGFRRARAEKAQSAKWGCEMQGSQPAEQRATLWWTGINLKVESGDA
jgi:hypothetical protein